jgi:membrane-bound serine protease (ClpP class)
LPFAVIFTILLVALLKSFNQRVSTGNEGMVGLTGIADNDIDVKGRVRIRGEYWSARADAPIPAGRPVRVVGVDNLTLRVEEVRN